MNHRSENLGEREKGGGGWAGRGRDKMEMDTNVTTGWSGRTDGMC